MTKYYYAYTVFAYLNRPSIILIQKKTYVAIKVFVIGLLIFSILFFLKFLEVFRMFSLIIIQWFLLSYIIFQIFTDLNFVISIGFLIICGTLLNLTQFMCTTYNSALTTSVVGVSKGVLVTLIGYFSFGGVKFHIINVTG